MFELFIRQINRIILQQLGTGILAICLYGFADSMFIPRIGPRWLSFILAVFALCMGFGLSIVYWVVLDDEYPLYDQRVWWKKGGVWVLKHV